MARVVIFVAAATACAVAAATAQDGVRRTNRTGCDATPSADRIVSVSERGDLGLASGRIARLAGVRFAGEPDERRRAVERLKQFAGFDAQTAAFGTSVDRWGRTSAIVVLNRDIGATDLARDLVGAGLAMVDAGEADLLCRTDLLVLEQGAREAGLGLWQGERHRPVPADDVGRLKDRVGRFAIVEGRVRSVGERQRRTYLNFGRDWANDFTVTIPQRTWDTMRHRGIAAGELRGQRIRVRGVVEEWQGPAITLVAGDLLELLESAPSPRR